MKPSQSEQEQAGPDELETERITSRDSERDLEADALLRAIAHAPPRHPRSALAPGTPWGPSSRYLIRQRLGRGGMGTVYAASDTVLSRIVALKVLDAGGSHDVARHARLLREAQLAARVEHERIARVYDVGTHDGLAFVAMEYVAGGTLRAWMSQRDIPVPQIVDIATQIAEGLAELHANGVIHRDLKPENVMLTSQGGVKLLDFGLARNTLSGDDAGPMRAATFDGMSIATSGTPGYMAPEQCAGRPIDTRVDIFSLGVIVYELITGDRLFRGATAEAIMTATLEGAPAMHDGAWQSIPQRLRDVTACMLAPDPDARFADGARALAALRGLATEMPNQRSRLPEATVQGLSRASTEIALPPLPPRTTRAAVAKHVARGAAVIAAVLLTYAWIAPSHAPRAPAPPGMVAVDVGAIAVGRNADEIDRECGDIGPTCARKHMQREIPRTEVTIPRFFLDTHEVTNEDFARMLNDFTNLVEVDPNTDDDHHYPRFVRLARGPGEHHVLLDLYEPTRDIDYDRDHDHDRRQFHARPGREHLPVSKVSWYGASLYCNNLGKRLPTEDEWEAAARGRQDRRFPWGDELPRCGDVVIPSDGRLPMSGRCEGKVAARAVGKAAQDVTPDAIHDLGGNVSEWTASRFIAGKRDAAADDAGATATDPARVIRGGSWASSLMVRTSGRWEKDPNIMSENLGFRCASDAATYEP